MSRRQVSGDGSGPDRRGVSVGGRIGEVRRRQGFRSRGGSRLYLFGWPGSLGGASTKFTHLLPLLARDYAVVVVPNDAAEVEEGGWADYLRRCGVSWSRFEDLPARLRGWGLALCNFEFLGSPRWAEVRRRGLRLAWSNEMMWTLPVELGAITLGQVDAVLYASEVQRRRLEPAYRRALTGDLEWRPAVAVGRQGCGWMGEGKGRRRLRWVVTGNYVDPGAFPFRERSAAELSRRPLVVGRLSRADPAKYPDDFPRFYEGLGLGEVRFRVMGWSPALAERWRDHRFDGRWELLPAMAEDTVTFLQSLDLFVYALSAGFRESWGRVVVEAMLTGAVPLVPRGGGQHFEHLVVHGRTGFLCSRPEDYGRHARRLAEDPGLWARMSRAARGHAEEALCRAAEHRRWWRRVFTGPGLGGVAG